MTTQPLPQTEVTDAQWIEFCRAQLKRKGSPPDGTVDPLVPLFDLCKPALTKLLDEAEAEPQMNVGSKIADVIFAIGLLDVTGRLGPLDSACGSQPQAPRS